MKEGSLSDSMIIHKDVVIIGNGPSGIALSYMLSGNLPFVKSDQHPDEMLSARLQPVVGQCLINQDLGYLATGLEGRSTNQVSLLFDALQHPCADVGLEMEPLIEFRQTGIEIDHIVLGKGPPGGSWHKMDPYILSLSLGSWMALPGLPFHSRDSSEKRAYAHNVAKYYVQYVEQMHLNKYFHNNVTVTAVKQIQQIDLDAHQFSLSKTDLDIPMGDLVEDKKTCFIANALNRLKLRSNRKMKCSRAKRQREDNSHDAPSRKSMCEWRPKSTRRENRRSISLSCDSTTCDNFSSSKDISARYSLRSALSLDFKSVPLTKRNNNYWLVQAVDNETGESTMYSCKYLILANGASDSPNRLDIPNLRKDPYWLMYDLRSLEMHLDIYLRERKTDTDEFVDPVLIIGAGLSAADAVIAVRGRNIPVVHVFRNKSADLNKQLPENMYPEYHKVHQMMQDGGSSYPYYTAYPEYNLTHIDEQSRQVTLTSKSAGQQIKLTVSFAAILIGSRPDLRFLPQEISNIGVNKNLPIDSKTNTIDIDKLSHKITGFDNLYAIGPLAGDNFVRFIPGGALSVVSDLYKKNNYC